MLLDKFKVTVNSSSRVDMRCDIVQSASVPYTDQGDLSGDNVGGNVSMTLDLRPGRWIINIVQNPHQASLRVSQGTKFIKYQSLQHAAQCP